MAFDSYDYAPDLGALQDMLSQQVREDAIGVCMEMNSPAVNRVRAEVAEPASYRLLALRSSRMSSARQLMQQRMLAVAEHTLPLEKESQRRVLVTEVGRALESCLRVLESTDLRETTALVAENVEAMSHNIGTMSTLLANRFPALSEQLVQASLRATEISANVDGIAAEMRAAYEQVRIELAKTGPRLESLPTPAPIRKDEEAATMRP
ncbi:hypothetical protein [Massilia varians]|uniref:hypothetical protein n=1 Tax=Massilia varians TaxID=457921 RepID=UPI00255637CA|nr:hypothetical protein [Massilia varians]MDK6076162.1 hypothetical protein [Massilia varians]